MQITRRRFKKSTNGDAATSVSNASRNGNSRNSNRPGKGKSKKKEKGVDPSLMVKKAVPLESTEYISKRTFDQMPIDSKLKECIRHKGFTRPTEIQDLTLESLMDGRDLLGIAQTGTGKTGAFLIPLIDRWLQNDKFQALVVVPTRELAVQVEEEFQSLTKGLRLFSATFIGGTNINRDMMKLRRRFNLVVGSPGRLLDLQNRRALNLADYSVLILDEYDRMLDMGFAPDVKRITDAMRHRNHTMLFSATMDQSQKKQIAELLDNPVEVKVSTGDITGDHIDQDVIRLRPDEDKFQVLVDMISHGDFEKVLVFAETKHLVARVNKKLKRAGVRSEEIHGNKTQNYRQNALNQFKDGNVQVLVATDVAARGLDVSDITHVINYDIPRTFDSYIHRIGRTGRAGKGGKAFTFVS